MLTLPLFTAGKSGVAITFLGNEDTDTMYDLKQMLSKSSISRVPEELRKHEAVSPDHSMDSNLPNTDFLKAQQRSARSGGGQKKIEESSGFGGKGGNW